MPTWKSIVCGVDSRRGCAEAVRLAARLAREQSAVLVLLHVLEEESVREGPPKPPTAAAALQDQSWLNLASDLRGEPVRMEVVAGDPADGVLQFARKSGCDLIVLGSHARTRASLALTSLVGKVIAHAPCPVIIVPSGMEDLHSDFPGQVA